MARLSEARSPETPENTRDQVRRNRETQQRCGLQGYGATHLLFVTAQNGARGLI